MDQIGGPGFFAVMPSLLETASGVWFGMILAGKNEHDIISFIVNGHSFSERILARYPPNVHSQGFVNPSSCYIERFVAKGLDHASKLLLRPLARHLRN